MLVDMGNLLHVAVARLQAEKARDAQRADEDWPKVEFKHFARSKYGRSRPRIRAERSVSVGPGEHESRTGLIGRCQRRASAGQCRRMSVIPQRYGQAPSYAGNEFGRAVPGLDRADSRATGDVLRVCGMRSPCRRRTRGGLPCRQAEGRGTTRTVSSVTPRFELDWERVRRWR